MKKFTKFLGLFTCLTLSCFATVVDVSQQNEEKSMVTFTFPKGWRSADTKELPPLVKAMLIGTGKENFPPSISLAVEPFQGTLKEYLKIVKNINETEKTEWKNLGKLTTKSGIANLSQFDETSTWGVARTMTAILVKDGNAYILSATALKSEFSTFYKDFFEAMKSFSIDDAKKEVADLKP